MQRALVTGATGFIGAHVVRAALDDGVEVRALARPNSDRRNLDGLPVEICEGDLNDIRSLERALQGIDTLFHVAARYDLSRRAAKALNRTNAVGTGILIRLALEAGVDRFVHTSSVATVGPPQDPNAPANETQFQHSRRAPGPYERSKALSEALVHRSITDDGLPAVIVLPTAPIGPLDRKPTPTGRLIRDAALGDMPAYIRSAGLNIVHVRDVAAGHILAARHGRIGERYILGHMQGNLTLHQIIERAAAVSGSPTPSRAISPSLAMAAAIVDEYLLSVLTRRQPRATIAGVRLARKRQYYTPMRAVVELKLPQTDLDDAFRDAVRWFTHGDSGER